MDDEQLEAPERIYIRNGEFWIGGKGRLEGDIEYVRADLLQSSGAGESQQRTVIWQSVFDIVSEHSSYGARELIKQLEAARERDGCGPIAAPALMDIPASKPTEDPANLFKGISDATYKEAYDWLQNLRVKYPDYQDGHLLMFGCCLLIFTIHWAAGVIGRNRRS